MALPDDAPNPAVPLSQPSSPRRRTGIRLAWAFLVLVALVAGVALGISYERQRNAAAADAIITAVINTDTPEGLAVDFSLFWQVWDRLHERYVDGSALDAQKLVYGAITGMVEAAGDPYTTFMPPEDSKKFQEEVSGTFSGVGMEVGERDGVITVIAPIKDSPAMRAGVLAGDRILEIDGTPTDGLSVEEAVVKIRGERGTVVKILILTPGADAPRTLEITRDTIRIPAVEWKMLDGGVAYLELSTFNANAADEFDRAAREILEAGATALIIDLRNNPGGLLDEAVRLTGWLLPKDSLVVQERFADGSTDELRTDGEGRLAGLRTVVIINGGSASASEIIAGALHDNAGIPLVGEQSYGKGSVQQLEQFYNGSSLKVTVAKWLTPGGISISDTGITPTHEVIMDPADAASESWEFGTPGRDPQLDRALEILRETR